MKAEEIIEGNKIIATFMGYKYYPSPAKDPGWRKDNGHLKVSRGYYLARTSKDLKYDNSWDWLIPVTHKIASIDKVYKMNMKLLPVTIERWELYEICLNIIKRYNKEQENGTTINNCS